MQSLPVLTLAVAIAVALAAGSAVADPGLPALNSYGQPPFVPVNLARHAGLAASFVQQLNEHVGPELQVDLENLPRRRLEQTLVNRSFSGLALFLAPEFLASPAQQGAAWSVPVMVDENLIVSVRPLKITSLQDLHGLRLGGIAGHIYRVLGPLVEEGRIAREDAVDHVSNLKKLCLGRVDIVVISRSELAGTEPHAPCAFGFRPMAFPEPQIIVRRVLVRLPNEEAAQDMLDAVAEVACSEKWTAGLARYGLSTVGCLRKNTARSEEPPAPAAPGQRRRLAPIERVQPRRG